MIHDVPTALAAAAIVIAMFTLGLGLAPRQLAWLRGHPGLVLRALFSVLVLVPVVAIAVERASDLPPTIGIGLALMAVAPGAPMALRRSLGAGGHPIFAPALQLLVAISAVAALPASIAILNAVYDRSATLAPAAVARQVFIAQVLPLGAGMLLRDRAPAWASTIEPIAARVSNAALIGLTVVILSQWQVLTEVGPRAVAAVVVITALALAGGHLLGGPDPGTRTAVAIVSAVRNPGLALLVASLNNAPPQAMRIILAYVIVSAFTVLPYAVWRRRWGLG